MKNILWLAFGVALGFVVAHQVNQTAEGKRFFSDLDKRTKGFTESVVDGYRERESELRAVLSDAGDTIASTGR
ncbi:hypothetical protein ASF79_07050 [Agreia sp. Leaf335]|uniref:hypothetical protein n=1 Tax=Agreia sp. Leaf335 TaxID=1736340 RepID=UPI0006FF9E2F|nr:MULTISPECIES: hypothetical protein [Microbacteriaceae]KQR22622.1 hypothetical protein ASF79_07050 [Agreia sp. Leaf335]PPF64654.1 hypothetical protein C5E11_03360 [Clavibacter michiganensis]